MIMLKRNLTIVLSVLAALIVSACTTVEVYQYQYDSTLDEVFVKQGVDFSRYDTVMIDKVSVWYPDKYAPPPERLEAINANLEKAQDLFRDSIINAISDSYAITDKPGRNVLRLHVEFVDLRAAEKDEDVPGDLARYQFNTKAGHITMIGQLFDAHSGEQLARAADLGKQQSIGGEGRVDWNAIASDFDYWADVFGAWLNRVHKQN
jgi:hypothetical protein